jgi:hypothetical protein
MPAADSLDKREGMGPYRHFYLQGLQTGIERFIKNTGFICGRRRISDSDLGIHAG